MSVDAGALARMAASHRITEVLSAAEQDILRRAARAGGLRGIASLHGISEEQARERVEAVVAKLRAASGQRASVNGAGSSAAPAVAGPPAVEEPALSSSSAIDRVLGYLREHSPARRASIMQELGMPVGTVSGTLAVLARRGAVEQVARGVWRCVVEEPAVRAQLVVEEPGPVLGGPIPAPARVAPPADYVVLWDLLLHEGDEWSADMVAAYVAACRRHVARGAVPLPPERAGSEQDDE